MFNRAPKENLYFLKTGNFLIPFRGYFPTKKKLANQLHQILEESLTVLVEEWEKTHDKKWTRPREDIISNKDMCYSVQVMKLNGHSQKFFSSFFVMQ